MTKQMTLTGRARKFGDNINTDYIISSRRKRDTLDTQVLRAFLFESIKPDFAESLAPNDMIVAGQNFGCGSAMEIAATVLSDNGIRCIVAESFARTYYRNLVNNGVMPVIAATGTIREGDVISVQVGADMVEVLNERTQARSRAEPIPAIMQKIVSAGGLVPLVADDPDAAFEIPS